MPVSTVTAALDQCARTSRWSAGMCGQFCAAMYGYGFSGYRDAVTQWNRTPSRLKFPLRTDAPPGALLFWGGGSAGHGHVAVCDGPAGVWSIDIAGPGTVSLAPAGTISSRWGLPYLGWALPYFQDEQWSPAMINGVDVSAYQADRGWEGGIDFAFTKVTEGLTYVNPRWVAQRDTMREAGLVVGYYHFARPGDMVAQADFFLSKISLKPGDVLAFDWEDAGVTNAQKDAWISYVQGKTSHRVVLYCNRDFWLNRDRTGFAGDGLWIATGPPSAYPAGFPGIKSPWLLHQYSTAGGLDHDVAQFSDRTAMAAWAGGGDVPLTDAEIKKVAAAAADAVFTKMFKTDDVLASPPDAADHATNPFWTFQTHVQAQTTTVRAVQSALEEAIAQVKASGAVLTEIKTTLSALDLSGLPDAVAAKLATLKIVLEEQA